MISHQHQCIFIHIPKCAGSSIEAAFDVIPKNGEWIRPNYETLMGWCPKNNLHLQHATPQQLLDHNYISKDIWDSYYKFVTVRNPYARTISDYNYLVKTLQVKDHFSNYISATGKFEEPLNDNSSPDYRGDHIQPMIDYFFLNNRAIQYDTVVRMETIQSQLEKVCQDLQLPSSFFDKKVNITRKFFTHYSKYYNSKRKKLVDHYYANDLDYFHYSFNDEKNVWERLLAQLPAYFLINI